MIELKNLSKIYNPKSGEVKALDDVSLILPEKGMTFILGKSGSGKTTLLNVIGGLDNYTCGDIVVDGVSLADYKGSDYDEYRNRYIGFVFQDYNLIENFNVGQNVNLALQLQSIENSRDLVEQTLDKVGLSGYYKRKISELSGGQRQRVAIARALVKNPKIILADEPTGNLDSATAAEIFDLLKSLSEDRLVLIVSHDRESAGKYADRIIELKDGKILSDVCSKNIEQSGKQSDNNCQNKNCENVKQSKKGCGYMSFSATLKYSFSNLWAKKIRVIASMICFILLLGLFNLAYGAESYDVYDRVHKTLEKQNAPAYFTANYGVEYYKDFDCIDKEYGGIGTPVYVSTRFNHYLGDNNQDNGYFNRGSLDRIMPINEKSLHDLGFDLISGTLPQDKFQVCLTKYDAERLLYFADEEFLFNEGISNMEDLVGKSVFNDKMFSIAGIIDTHVPQKYEQLKSLVGVENYRDTELYTMFNNLVLSTYHNTVMCHEDYFNEIYLPCGDDFTFIQSDTLYRFEENRDAFRINQLDLLGIKYAEVPPYVSTDGVVVSSSDARYFIKASGYGDLLTDYSVDTMRDIISKNEVYADLYYDYDKKNEVSNVGYHKNIRVIGFYDEKTYGNLRSIFVSDSVLEDMKKDIGCVIGVAFGNDNHELINSVLNETSIFKGTDFTLNFVNDETFAIEQEHSYSNQIKYIAGGATGLFIVIVVIMMLNYFFSTIKDKTEEIGILRAIGVKQSNVVMIFVIEALIISLISYLISLPISFYMAHWVEKIVTNAMVSFKPNYIVHFVMVGLQSSMITLALCFGIVLLGSVLPFLKLTKLKPMEIMRKK